MKLGFDKLGGLKEGWTFGAHKGLIKSITKMNKNDTWVMRLWKDEKFIHAMFFSRMQGHRQLTNSTLHEIMANFQRKSWTNPKFIINFWFQGG